MANDVYESAREAAEAIGTTQPTVSAWISNGRLKAERIARGGKGAYRIRHVDLIEASRGTMFEQDTQPQLRLDTSEDPTQHALSLEVLWPDERRSCPFDSSILAEFNEFRAVTYTVSLPSIFKLLSTQDYEFAEVIFGDERLVRANSAQQVVLLQEAIENEVAKTYIAIGGDTDPRAMHLMERQGEGRAAFYAVGGGVVHSKMYFLERPGLRRVLVGSANLSETAMSGKQGEVLLAYDNHDWMWDTLMRKYEAVKRLTTGLQLKGETKPAHLVRAEDLPAGREAKGSDKPVTIYVLDQTDKPGDPEYIAVRAKDLDGHLGEALRENIKPLPDGKAILQEASIKRINYAAAPKRTEDPAKLHRLDCVRQGGLPPRFVYDGRPIERPASSEGIMRDALLITQYIDKFHEFGERSDLLQQNYFRLMGWLYFSPFMPALARQLHIDGGNASKELQHMAVIYGQSDCGKSALTRFLLTSMFGPPAELDDSNFTQTDFKGRTTAVGVLPIFYQDISGSRFAGRGDRVQGEVIVKYYDQLVSRTSEYPCAVITSNADAAEFANEVRNRAFLVYTPKGLASDDVATRKRLDKEALPLINRIGQDFYNEYLYRMAEIRTSDPDPANFDYMLASTSLIREMLIENLHTDEVLPVWARPTMAGECSSAAWGLKHEQMASRLNSKSYTPHPMPAEGFWTANKEEILVGVNSVRETLRAREVQDHWVKRESTYGTGKVLHLHRDEVVASIQRTNPEWRLPVPWFKRPLFPVRRS